MAGGRPLARHRARHSAVRLDCWEWRPERRRVCRAHQSLVANVQGEIASLHAASEKTEFKLSDVLDLYAPNSEEVGVFSETQLTNSYPALRRAAGGMPPPEEDPTAEQIAAVSHRVRRSKNPNADYAILGPHGYRLLK